jgi:hypothetical protein
MRIELNLENILLYPQLMEVHRKIQKIFARGEYLSITSRWTGFESGEAVYKSNTLYLTPEKNGGYRLTQSSEDIFWSYFQIVWEIFACNYNDYGYGLELEQRYGWSKL